MATVDGGRLVVDALEREGVEYIFSLSGGHINAIYQACLDSGIRVIDTRHEQAAAMMAHAWSIYRGQTGVCLVTAGPGFTNALTGIVNAFQENAPVVFISGVSPIREDSLGALQEINQLEMIKATVRLPRTTGEASSSSRWGRRRKEPEPSPSSTATPRSSWSCFSRKSDLR